MGWIYIVGNDVTYQDVFLDRLGLFGGQRFTQQDLRKAERRLLPLRWLGILCSVTALEQQGDSEYVDVLVRVKEAPITRVLSPLYRQLRAFFSD